MARRSDRGSRRSTLRASMDQHRSTGEAITPPPHHSTEKSHGNRLPMHMPYHRHKKTKGIQAEGESGRSGIHPWHFLRICFRSSCTLSMIVNVLWPAVPAAIAVHFALPDYHVLGFLLAFIAMIPSANLIGFAGQELARKMPKVLGVLMETTLGSVVEIILFMTLIVKNYQGQFDEHPEIPITVIRAAILGSILANLLLCLGLCFIAGGIRHEEQVFHEAVSEVGSNLLLVAGFGLVIPAAFVASTSGAGSNDYNTLGVLTNVDTEHRIQEISRATAIILLIAYVIYVFFQTTSHHGLYDEVLERDEQLDKDREKDLNKSKLTFTECLVALVIAIACVAMMAVFLVINIEPIVVDHGVPDAFMGLILVPLVEKAAEHLTAIDEAWDNQANFALVHVLGASIQTALLNTPLVIIVGWGLGTSMDLGFRPFEAIVLILAILVVGNFLRDGKSNYLEGALCVLTYIIIAVAAFYYPNPPGAEHENPHGEAPAAGAEGGHGEAPAGGEVAHEAAKLLMRSVVG